MAAEDTSPAEQVETISPAEAQLRQSSGGYQADGTPAPEAAVVDSQGQQPGPVRPKKQASPKQVKEEPSYYNAPPLEERMANKAAPAPAPGPQGAQPQQPSYYDAKPYQEPPPPPGPPPPPPSLWDRTKAAVANAYASVKSAATEPGGADELVNSIPENAASKPFTSFMRQYLEDKQAADQQLKESGDMAAPDASALDPRNVSVFAAKAALALFNEGWSATGIPSAIHLLVSKPSKDLLTAGADAINKSGLVQPGEQSAPGLGVSQGDVSRTADALSDVVDTVAQNAIPLGPHVAHEHFNPSSLQGDIAKGLPVDPGKVTVGRVAEQPVTAMEHAQIAAANAVKAEGGDELDQVVAATHANSAVGAAHDAVFYETAMQRANELALQPDEPPNKGVVEPNAGGKQIGADDLSVESPTEEAKRVPAAAAEVGAPEPTEAPPPSTLFERREQEQAKAKDDDYTKALNQKGDQEVQIGDTLAAGAEKGGATEAPPTLGDTLSDEQKGALKTLAARRMEAQAPAPEEKVMPYTEPKGGETNPIVGTQEAPKAPQTLAARRGKSGMQAPELPPEEREPASGKMQGPDLRVQAAREPDQPVEGDEWAAKNGGTFEVIKDNGDGTFKVRSTPADSTQAPIIRTMKEAAVAVLRARTEEPPTSFADKPSANRFAVKYVPESKQYVVTDTHTGVDQNRKFARRARAQSIVDSLNRKEGVENNASGESSASLEAQNRNKDEVSKGQTRHLIDPDGNVTPLTGVDAVDAKAPKGHVVYQKGTGIVDRGGLSPMHANGLVSRARAKGFDTEPTQMRGPKGWDLAEGRPAGMTRDAVVKHLQPTIDKIGADKVQVHDSAAADTVPAKIKDDMQRSGRDPANVRGAYSPSTDTVHVFAGAHDSAADVHDTLIHELAHQGVRSFLGDDFHGAMRDIYANLHDHDSALSSPIDGISKSTGKAWMRDYMDQHGMNARDPSHQVTAANEYVAHLAEHPEENPSILRRAIDAVRAGLRKLGVVREWTDADVRRLLRESDNNQVSEHARAAKEYKADTTNFADKEDRKVDQLPADNPLAQAHKFGKTMEDQANYNPGYVRSRLNAAKDWGGDRMRDGLMMIHMRNLPDFMKPELMPSLRQFIRTHDAMSGRRGALMNESAGRLQDWSRWSSKNKEQAKSLGDLMHSSTLAGVDPSKPFEHRYSDAERAADATKVAHDQSRQDYHRAARQQYNRLDDTGKKLFNDVRDHYTKQRKDIYDALNARINASGADDKTKQAVMSQLRKTFESGRVQGPYFPLMRYGDRMASAHDKEGNVVAFSRFEGKSEQQAWLNNMKEKGFEVRAGQKMDDKSMMERIDPKFVQKVMDITKDSDPKLADEIWQTYLKAMPEMSMRKQFIHRIGRLGYTIDAMRNFAYNSFHGAHQLARLEYGHRLDTSIDQMKTEANAVMEKYPGSKNADWAPALAKEMARRYEWVKNPRASPMASAITKFGFGWYLGAAPATAFRIFSQNPMLAQPILAGHHGQLGATRELSRASAQWAMSKGSLADKLRGDERKAFDTAADRGVFSSTATQTLASGASDIPVTGTSATVMKAMGYLFNAMEHHNRMTTYLAGYRLGKQQGMTHDQAVDHATDTTWDAHFDYTNANRPRVLQNDVAKVLGLFKQYSWGVTYRLAREARNMIDGELSGADRIRATKTFGGLLARVSMFSGATGLPLSWVATSVINAVMHNKDQPFDAEAAAHEYLKQHIGSTAADAVMTGPIGAMSGASLSGGASYSDLWYRAPSRDENAHDTVLDALAQIGGAMPAIPLNAASGASMMADGQIERGLEHFAPPEVAALMKSRRYAKEGVTNLQGESVVDRDKLDNKDLFLQAIGFTPQKVADAYRQNATLKNISKAIMDRKQAIENAIAVRGGMGDEDGIQEAMEEAQQFNETNPGVAINAKGLLQSVKGHFLNQAEAVNGVRLPPGLNSLRDTYAAPEESK